MGLKAGKFHTGAQVHNGGKPPKAPRKNDNYNEDGGSPPFVHMGGLGESAAGEVRTDHLHPGPKTAVHHGMMKKTLKGCC